ncbi:MAG: hypothetical protein HY653_02520, partial [Acidobacteria bacterium]|nr:hypothetical protein [Acidobacteriota bacterium]
MFRIFRLVGQTLLSAAKAVAARLGCPAAALAAALNQVGQTLLSVHRRKALLLLLLALALWPGPAIPQAVPAENVAHLSFQSLIADPSNLASGSCFYRSDLDQLRCQVGAIVTVFSTIQAAIDKIPSTGGTVLIPAGTYTECGITLKS